MPKYNIDNILSDWQKIVLRPSSVKSYVSCPYKWFLTYIVKVPSSHNVRAAVGTGVHAGVEAMWREAMIRKDKTAPNINMMLDAAIDSYDKDIKSSESPVLYDEDVSDDNKARDKVKNGIESFVADILPPVQIPVQVETYLAVDIKHSMIKSVGGTIDYLGNGIIADIKTGKTNRPASEHVLQQSIYRYVAEKNGYPIKSSYIQKVIFSAKKTYGAVEELEANTSQALYIVNSMLDKLTALSKGVSPDLLFHGNTTCFLCSSAYCSSYKSCPYVNGITEAL